MNTGRPDHPDEDALLAMLGLAGDEAILPTGSVLVAPTRPCRHCFAILAGEATIEFGARHVRTLGVAAYVGGIDPAGLPVPLDGVTVTVRAPTRVLVLDPDRLAAQIRTDSAFAAAWHAWAAGCNRIATTGADNPESPSTPIAPIGQGEGGSS